MHVPNTRFPMLRPSADGKWLRCPLCSDAYWGAFRPTDVVAAKLGKHLASKHKDAAEQAEAAGEAAAAELPRAAAPKVVPQVAPLAGMAPLGVAPKRNAKKADPNGEVRVVRAAGAKVTGPRTADMVGMPADPLADIAFELDPRLQLGQGPRDFPEEGGRARRARLKRGFRIDTRVAKLLNMQGAA